MSHTGLRFTRCLFILSVSRTRMKIMGRLGSNRDCNIVENNRWLDSIAVRRDKTLYKHYQVCTYDFMYHLCIV